MPIAPIEWYDDFIYTKERKVYTQREHGIPGLRMFGYHSANHALPALSMHYHKNCFEFTYIVQGNIRFSIQEQRYSLTGGDMFVVLPDEIHDTGNIPMSLHQMYWFQLEANDPERFLYMTPSVARCLIDQLMGIRDRVIKVDNGVGALLTEIFQNISSQTQLGRIQAGHLLGVLLCQILKDADAPAFRITPDIGRTTDYILEHIQEELPMEELAKVALLSVSRFKQKFKNQLGTSPRSFINYHKIEQAKKLLQEGQSVTETAMELSFSSSNYFSTVFRRYTSISPTEYIDRTSGKSREPNAGG